MANTVIIYGPQGCGKTLNAERFRKAFGCTHGLVDGWEPGQLVESGKLHLTNADLSEHRLPRHVTVYSFRAADLIADAEDA